VEAARDKLVKLFRCCLLYDLCFIRSNVTLKKIEKNCMHRLAGSLKFLVGSTLVCTKLRYSLYSVSRKTLFLIDILRSLEAFPLMLLM
jgi:hypothetical protein